MRRSPLGLVVAGLWLMASASSSAQQPVPTYSARVVAGLDAGWSTLFPIPSPGYLTRDGHGLNARFDAPHGIVSDGAGGYYIADNRAHVIRRLAADGTVTTVAGAPGQTGSTDGVGSAARFNRPIGLARSAAGMVYIADSNNRTVRQLAPDGTVSTFAGAAGVHGSTDGSRLEARFGAVFGLALDAAGTLYVSEQPVLGTSGNGESVRRITPAGDVSTVVGFSHSAGNANGPVSTARLQSPRGLAVDSGGNIFVTDAWGLRHVSADGVVSTIPEIQGVDVQLAPNGDVLVGALGVSFRGIYRRTPDGVVHLISSDVDSLGRLTDLQVLGGIVPLADGSIVMVGSSLGLVSIRRPDGTIDRLAGSQGYGFADAVGSAAAFNWPRQIALDHRGALFVADYVNGTIRRVAPSGQVTSVVGGAGLTGYVDGPASSSRLRGPSGVAVDTTGRLVFLDAASGTVRVAHAGQVSTLAGADQQFGETNGVGGAARFPAPPDLISLGQLGRVEALPSGDLAIVDFSGRLRHVTAAGAVTTVPGSYGVVTAAADGSLWHRDSSGALVRVTTDGTVSTVGSAPCSQESCVFSVLTRNPAGQLYLFERGRAENRLYRVATDGTLSLVGRIDIPTFTVNHVVVGPQEEVYYVADTYFGDQRHQIWVATPSAVVAPSIGTVSNVTAASGSSAQFSATVAGMPTPGLQWQSSADGGTTWSDLTEAAPYAGVYTSTLTVQSVSGAMHGRRFRLVATNLSGETTSNAAVLSVTGVMVAPASLRFSAIRNTGVRFSTPAQLVTVGLVEAGVQWTATGDQPWLSISPATGTGVGQLSIGIVDAAVPSGTAFSGTVTVRVPASGATATVAVTLTVIDSVTQAERPFGVVDTPVQDAAGVTGAIALTGWVLDDVGVDRVLVYRSCLPADTSCENIGGAPNGGHYGPLAYLGQATMVSGARPDVEALYPQYPAAQRAGWGFMVLSNMLPNIPAGTLSGGVGAVEFHVLAFGDYPGVRRLGRTLSDETPTRVTLANDTIAKPFGAIDTPAQGATVSGTINNFGWALTPDPGSSVLIPTNGSTVTVFLDGAPVGTTTYNLCRGSVAVNGVVPSGQLCDDDVSSAFRGDGTRFRNLDAGRGPIGLRAIDTSSLSNGQHTLSWSVTDSANRSEGIGSRYINVVNSSADSGTSVPRHLGTSAPRNSGTSALRHPGTPEPRLPLYARTGFDLSTAFVPLRTSPDGVPQVRIPELGRVELQVPGVTSGVLLVNGDARALPIGVGIDPERGSVTWAPGPGFLGTYRLALITSEPRNPGTSELRNPGTSEHRHPGTAEPRLIDVTVLPAQIVSDATVRMHLDRISVEGPALSERTVRVEGWALDPGSASGSGVGAVHVWARRRSAEVPESRSPEAPVFLGVATLGVSRPDVAAAHGAEYVDAGFVFTGVLPDAGDWEVTAYVWLSRTGRFEDARSVRLRAR